MINHDTVVIPRWRHLEIKRISIARLKHHRLTVITAKVKKVEELEIKRISIARLKHQEDGSSRNRVILDNYLKLKESRLRD